MSLEESLAGTAPGEIQPPEMYPTTSASNNVNGQLDRLVDSSLPTASSSQSSLSQPTSSSLDGTMLTPGSDVLSPSGTSTPDVDAQIIEALKSKDRLFVLKLGEQMEGLIRERHSRTKVLVAPENSYQRLLVHRCAAYYKLTPESDPVNRCFSLHISVESRLPARRISELVPSEQASQPQFKIMRRIEQDRRRQRAPLSRAGSVAGEEADGSDREPSEAGSMGGRSNASKKRSLAEREAAYLEARARIFHDLQEKESEKDRNMSASSSTLSLTSASASGSGSGGAGGSNGEDLEDDNRSTAPTESEWSGPTAGNQARMEANSNAAGQYLPRSSPYNSHNGSAHASERASPNSFNYASISDPHHPPAPSEPMGFPQGTYLPQFPVYYHPPGQPVPYPPYHYYPPYPYPPHLPPPHPSHATSDPVSPVTAPIDGYSHTPQNVPYMHPMPYMWQAGPPPVPCGQIPLAEGHTPPGPSPQAHSTPTQGGATPIPFPPPPFPYMTPHQPYGPPYPAQPYSAITGPPPMNHPHSQPTYPSELPPINNPSEQNLSGGSGPPSTMSSGTNSPSPTMSRRSNGIHTGNGGHQHQNNTHSGNGFNGYKRGGGPPPNRGAWSYGPGVGMHQNIPPYNSNTAGEVVGPRFGSVRRASGASSNGNRTTGDETASTASSSASSSSSRRTYTSNMSTPPKHPLPPRPDWATGLKAQPTLHPPRSRHDNNNNSRNMSPARPSSSAQAQNQSQQPQQLPPIFLQPTDFPPLSTVTNTDKRPSVGGAWTNPKSTARTILASSGGNSSQGQGASYGNALFNHGPGGNQNTATNRLEDEDRGFERPPPKTNTELFNPKGGAKRNPQASAQREQPLHTSLSPIQIDAVKTEDSDKIRGEAVADAILIERVSALKLQVHPDENEKEGAGSRAKLASIVTTDATAPAADGAK